MKTALVALAMLAASTAHAESFFAIEAGAGVTNYTRTGLGIYYSPPLPAHAPTTAFAWRAGVVLTPIQATAHSIVPGLRVHADYINFGGVSWSAKSPEDTTDSVFTAMRQPGGYDPHAASGCLHDNCGQMSDFESFGRIQALALTVEPYWNLGRDITVGFEFGPALYRDTWVTHATVETEYGTNQLGAIGTVHTLTTPTKLHVTLLVGASVSKGPFSVRYNYIFARQSSTGSADNQSPSGVKGAHMVTLNYTY